YVDSVFAGATSDMVQLRFTWAISKSVTEVKSADVFGNMEVLTANDTNIVLYNKDRTITLSQDGTIDIMGEMKFHVADDASNLRYYPMVQYQIGAGPTTTGTPTPSGTGTPTTNLTNVTTPTETGTVVATGTEAVSPTATPAPTATAKEPGFEAGLAIAGLLAVAFLVLRQRK
ncbi:MAG: S-layer protein domain-containing protein, partial [Candidatus Methanoperedens sp.]